MPQESQNINESDLLFAPEVDEDDGKIEKIISYLEEHSNEQVDPQLNLHI